MAIGDTAGCRQPALQLALVTVALSVGLAHAEIIIPIDSIANALASIRDGDTILLVGPRTFYERVVITNSVHLLGTNSPVIDADRAGTPLTISAPDVEVRGVTVRNSGRDLTTVDSGIMIAAARATIRDCIIENDAFGIYVRGVSGCRIERNAISGSKELPSAQRGGGIHLEDEGQPHHRQSYP